jgi:hypothetical protein
VPAFLLSLPGAALAALAVALVVWQRRNRAFRDTASVAEAYDRWTGDRLLERLWGEHVHLGHYPTGTARFPCCQRRSGGRAGPLEWSRRASAGLKGA